MSQKHQVLDGDRTVRIVPYRASQIGWSQTGHSQNGLQPNTMAERK